MRLTVKVYQKYTRLTDGDSKGKGSFQPDSRWKGEQFNSKHSQPTAVSSEDLLSKFTLLMLSCGLLRHRAPPHWQRVGWEAWLGPGQLAAHGRALSPLIQAP